MRLSKRDAEFFLQIFKFYPFAKIAAISDVPREIYVLLEKRLEDCGGNLDIYEKESFRSKRGFYDYVILCDTLDENVLQNAKNSLKAVAEIVVVLDKRRFERYEAEEKILNADFTAVNSIDLFEDYHLVTAKRLLMYGA